MFTVQDIDSKYLEEKLVLLQKEIRDLAIAVDYQGLPQGFFHDHNKLRGRIIVRGATHGKTNFFIIASQIGTLNRRPVFHLGLTLSASENKKTMQKGYAVLLVYCLFRSRSLWYYITSITNNPKIFGNVADRFFQVYPGFDGELEMTPWHAKLFEMIIAQQLPSLKSFAEKTAFVENQLVLRHMMGKTWNRKIPLHRNESYNKYFLKLINPHEGDCIMQAGKFRLIDLFRWPIEMLLKPYKRKFKSS